MFAQVHSNETLDPQALDEYLERGWFRMGQTIFTTNFLNFKNQYYSAIWLRIPLDEFSMEKTFQKLSKRNARFKVEFQEASITPAQEALYLSYKKNISFEPSASLHSLLFGKASHNIYNTKEVNLFDGEKLIAAGFFDVGKISAAGITSFYDPDYKKYSLGKYLIYLKIEYCKKHGLQYFYPGYFVPGYPLFDYKLEIGKPLLQYLDLTSKDWLEMGNFSNESIPLLIMEEKLKALQILLSRYALKSQILKYEFFDVNLIPELGGIELFDFPIFLFCEDLAGENLNLFVYDVSDHQYHWLRCKSVWASNAANDQRETYSSHVLKLDGDLLITHNAEALAAAIQKELLAKLKPPKTWLRNERFT
ncbi:MAG TPA: GNAT family N-acetyltransferase [Chryseolinea sp.]|nr:GNAT family N-acetyltransferase [Chryseolinea sp.]